MTRNPNHDERTRTHYKETRKVLKMLIVVVVVFAILVLPLHIVYIWYDFFDGGKRWHYTSFLHPNHSQMGIVTRIQSSKWTQWNFYKIKSGKQRQIFLDKFNLPNFFTTKTWLQHTQLTNKFPFQSVNTAFGDLTYLWFLSHFRRKCKIYSGRKKDIFFAL